MIEGLQRTHMTAARRPRDILVVGMLSLAVAACATGGNGSQSRAQLPEEVTALLGHLDDVRAQKGVGASAIFSDLQPIAAEAAQRAASGRLPISAVAQHVANEVANKIRRPASTWVAIVDSVTTMPFADELLEADPLFLAAGVAHDRRPNGTPEGYVVVLIIADAKPFAPTW